MTNVHIPSFRTSSKQDQHEQLKCESISVSWSLYNHQYDHPFAFIRQSSQRENVINVIRTSVRINLLMAKSIVIFHVFMTSAQVHNPPKCFRVG